MLGIIIALATIAGRDPLSWRILGLHLEGTALILSAMGLVAAAGIIDDIVGLKPRIKLALEVAAAILAYIAGCRIEVLFGLPLGRVALLITIAWVVAVANAFNLIDGLDGLAAGTGAIIGMTLLFMLVYLNQPRGALVMAATTGALAGFLPFNLNRARIFLGDSGSLLIGAILALVSIQTSDKLATGIAILVPALAMGLPLAEIGVTVLRRMLRGVHVVRRDAGRERYQFVFAGKLALFTADRDHLHHRLLALGITKKRTVFILYSATAVMCGLAYALVMARGADQAIIVAFCGVAAIVAVRRLGYEEFRPLANGLLLPMFDLQSVNYHRVKALLDAAFVIVSYVGALKLTGADGDPGFRSDVLRTLPLVALVELAVFTACGLYRVSFRFLGIADLIAILRAITLATITGAVASVLVAGTWSLAMWVLDGYFLATLVCGLRISFRLLEHARAACSHNGAPVLIYGAGRAGALAQAELQSNPRLRRFAVGFLDDDPSKHGSTFRGLCVYGLGDLDALIGQHGFHELLVASNKIPEPRLREVARRCVGAGLVVRRLVVDWRAVSLESGAASNSGDGEVDAAAPATTGNPDAAVMSK